MSGFLQEQEKTTLARKQNLRGPEATEETNETQISGKQESSLLQRELAICWANT